MNEEELKKGCRIPLNENGEIEEDTEICYPFTRCGFKSQYGIHLCPTCQARLEGFQKGKLEQKREELTLLEDLLVKYNSRWLRIRIKEEIKQLQKEIGGMK